MTLAVGLALDVTKQDCVPTGFRRSSWVAWSCPDI